MEYSAQLVTPRVAVSMVGNASGQADERSMYVPATTPRGVYSGEA
jgi:hypothetical protein